MNDDDAIKATNPDDDIEVDSNLVLKLMGQQDDRIARLEDRNTRKDELLLGMQREISLLASAISGHQRILEANQPEREPGPPPPPTIMH
jgi:hypothetical protein